MVGTQVSGYMSKELLAAFQSEVLGPKDSDCGTKKTITIKLTNANFKDFAYQYVKTENGYEVLSSENKSKFIGKTIQLRSPMYCVGTGNQKCLCNKCGGDFFYLVEKPNIGLTTSKVATTLTQLSLQKFHQNLVKTHEIDLDSLFI